VDLAGFKFFLLLWQKSLWRPTRNGKGTEHRLSATGNECQTSISERGRNGRLEEQQCIDELVMSSQTKKPMSGQVAAIVPEWITVAEACRFAAVSKPVIYGWMNRGLIKNFSARERGQVRGVRRVSFDSLRAFLNGRATGGEA